MNIYPQDLFFKELPHCSKIDEHLLAHSKLPTLTEDDQISAIERRNKRFTSIMTDKGMVKNAYYVNKAVDDHKFCDHIREILANEIDGREIQVKRQWHWGANNYTPHVDGHGRDPFLSIC